MTKECPKCKLEKSEDDFYKRSSGNLTSWCRICIIKDQKEKVKTDRGREALRKRQKKWKEENKVKIKQQGAEKRARQKEEVMKAYGGRCNCCQENEPMFLTIDHIHGRTSSDNYKSAGMYAYLVREEFPKGYQILCSNCNSGRYRNGGICPHIEKSSLGETPSSA